MSERTDYILPEGVADPNLDHIKRADYNSIYEPSEDSFLVMEAFEKDRPFLASILPSQPTILEIGVGSGILSTYASILLRNSLSTSPNAEDSKLFQVKTFGVDINPAAVSIANETYQRNNIDGQVYLSDLVTEVSFLLGKVDVMIFNPPYVPSDQCEMNEGDMLAKSYAGGDKGREVLDRLIDDIPKVLSPLGFFYVVVLHPANDIDELTLRFEKIGFVGSTVVARREGIEMLAIIRYSRIQTIEEVKKYVPNTIFEISTRLNANASTLNSLGK